MTDAIQRAEHAKRILSDELVQEAFATIEKDFITAWRATGVSQAEERERIYTLLRMADSFRLFFQKVMEQGLIHQHQLQALKRGQI